MYVRQVNSPKQRIVPGNYGRNALAIGYAKDRRPPRLSCRQFTEAVDQVRLRHARRSSRPACAARSRRRLTAFVIAPRPRYTRATIGDRSMSDMRLIVAGAGGRMGRTLIQAIAATDGAVLAGAVDAPGSAADRADAGELAGLGANGIKVTTDAAAAARDGRRPHRFHDPGGERDLCRARGRSRQGARARHHRLLRREREADRGGREARRHREVRQHEPRASICWRRSPSASRRRSTTSSTSRSSRCTTTRRSTRRPAPR